MLFEQLFYIAEWVKLTCLFARSVTWACAKPVRACVISVLLGRKSGFSVAILSRLHCLAVLSLRAVRVCPVQPSDAFKPLLLRLCLSRVPFLQTSFRAAIILGVVNGLALTEAFRVLFRS